jgi:hypothetical protein
MFWTPLYFFQIIEHSETYDVRSYSCHPERGKDAAAKDLGFLA